jgi:hypothetical protein
MITFETRDKVERYLENQGITRFFVYIADAEDGHLIATSKDEYEIATLLGNLINYHPQIAKSYALSLVTQMGSENAREILEWAIDVCANSFSKEPAKIH